MIMDHMHGFNEMHVLIFVNFFILFLGGGGLLSDSMKSLISTKFDHGHEHAVK
jgi:hypothetical protein